MQGNGCSKKSLIISGSVIFVLIIGSVSGLVYYFKHSPTDAISDDTQLPGTRDSRSLFDPTDDKEESKGS